jgi:hypothetical protein
LLGQGFELLAATNACNGLALCFWPSEADQRLLLLKCWCAGLRILLECWQCASASLLVRCISPERSAASLDVRRKQLLDSFILPALLINASLGCACLCF